MLRTLVAFWLAAAMAYAEHLVFTTQAAPPSCPVVISAPEQSRDFGFQSVYFRNDSDKPIQALNLTAMFYTAKSRDDGQEDIVDSGHIYVSLEPGEEKRLDVFLGRISALSQKLKYTGQAVAWVKLLVDGAEFSDGSRWDLNTRAVDPIGVPIEPARPK